MRQRYFFDKRDIKYFLIKYGIMLLFAIPILVGINIMFRKWFDIDNMVFLNVVFLCVIVAIYELIFALIKRKKESKSNKENTNEK